MTEDDKHFVDLTIQTESGDPAALVSTTTHPFRVEPEGSWVDAGDLEPGMTLRTPAGDTPTLQATRYFDQRQRTHNLTVTGIHTYLDRTLKFTCRRRGWRHSNLLSR
ncbi:polymorphic toxin-type HINT domain-containing protein [Streptomyces sp. NPDC057307]|uniref:polymorphic toxin-type HINT domain-containing protein n=1 Tax=Streptomyces sp. NPDC057307 TaxID=3346096 RepID=UPI0036392685